MRTALLVLCLLAVSATVSVHAAEAARATHTMFKGVELYSWNDTIARAWHFSLLPATNRNKTATEITSAKLVIADIPTLKRRLALLARGEQVFWSSPKSGNFAFPPAATVHKVVKFGTTIDVTVTIAR